MTSRAAVRGLLVLGALTALTFMVRAALGTELGLQAEYFKGTQSSGGAPSFAVVQPDITTERVTKAWLGDPPPQFRVRWYGYLIVRDAGAYTFATRSDDGSSLAIDGTVVVENGGVHGAETRTGTIVLDRGAHAVLVEYLQAGGDFDIAVLWGRGTSTLVPIPSTAWSPRRAAAWKIRTAVFLTWTASLLLVTSIIAAVWTAARVAGRRIEAAVAARPRLVSLVLFALLAAAETWPLAAHPARLSRNDNGDTMLNEWTLAWVAHQAPRAPFHLYDGNIFHPERRTLAYSEAMIVQSAMAAPFLWLGGSPVLAYNLVLLAGFALSGWTMSLVLAQWTGSWIAAVTGGILFAFNAHVFTRLPHLQAQHVEFLPLALLALDRLLTHARTRDALSLAGWFALQALTSIYLLVFSATALVAAALGRPEAWIGARFRSVAPKIVLAAALASVVLLPFVLPYWRVSTELGVTRTLEDATGFAASWNDYLATPARLDYGWWSHRFFAYTALFPGAIGLVLAAIALASGEAFTNPRARMCLILGGVGVYLSFGTKAPGYVLLYHAVPLLHAVRAVSRFGYLGIVATAVLAAFGVARLQRVVRARPLQAALVVIPVLVAVEASPAPIWYSRFEGIPSIYDRLRSEPDAVAIELPFFNSAAAFRHAAFMLNSTRHWKSLINGYSGFQPPSFYRNAEVLAGFPNEASIGLLQSLGVTHVFVHTEEFSLEAMTSLEGIGAFRRMASEGSIVLYGLAEGEGTNGGKPR